MADDEFTPVFTKHMALYGGKPLSEMSEAEAGTPVDALPLPDTLPVAFGVPEVPRNVIDPGPDPDQEKQEHHHGHKES